MNDFKTSTGVEFRFFVPMLNVPFRVIYSYNMQRDGVYNDNFQPQEKDHLQICGGLDVLASSPTQRSCT